MREEIVVSRECRAIQIPSGYDVILPEGTRATIIQSLGGAFTLITQYGMMVRVAGTEVTAIGKDLQEGPVIEGEATKEKLEELVWEQLRTCFDPEIPVNIVDLGLVYQNEVSPLPEGGFRVDVKMTLTAPGCGMGPVLAADVRGKVMNLPQVKLADIQVVFDPVWDRSMMTEAAKLQLGMW